MSSPKAIITPQLLLQTKLHQPRGADDLIVRPHLLDRLNQGLKSKLTLISAPPGFGKTILAGQWLADCDRPSAWLSLDEGDNQLPKFLSYLCAAVRLCFPEACATLQNLLNTAYLPDLDYLADLLVEELNVLPAELILVLDNYHHIHASDVHRVMRRLLRYRPPRLHLVILTRSDPPLFLGRLRVGDQITEIRAADLRFALAETRLFFQRSPGPPLDDKVIQDLHARTEGWIIGLQLAAISLQDQSPAQFLARFGGSHQMLAGYLMEEVMANLPEAVTEFLTRTALMDRFCSPLSDALLAGSPWPDSGQATIARLEAQNLFIIPLDDEGVWFRYHDLFREFLLHRLKNQQDQAGLARLHQRAGHWLAQAGLIEDALHHTLAAGDEAHAIELVETNLQLMLNQQVPSPVLTRWLNLFPEHTIQTQPGLLIAQLYLFAFRWDMAAIAATVDRIGKLLQADSVVNDDRRRLLLALLDGMKGYVLYWQGDAGQAIPLLRRSLDNLQDPVAYSFTYAHLINTLALAYATCGQRETALALLRMALTEATRRHRPTMLIFLGGCALIHLYAGELAEAAAAAEEILALADSPQARPDWSGIVQVWRSWAYYYLGASRYEQNDLEAAAQHWQQVETMHYQANPGIFHGSLTGLALIAQAQGAAVKALAYAQAAREFAGELCSPPLLALSEALETHLTLLGGNQSQALRRSREINTDANQSNAIWLRLPNLIVLQAMLAEATPDSLNTALELAQTCLRQAENAHNIRQVIQITALQALIWYALRRTDQAFEALNRALILAEPRQFTRTFLDLGPPMAELLQQFDHRRGPALYVNRLLAAFARELDPAGRRNLTAQYIELYHTTPLTPRELELLALIGRRLTVNEMAEQLVISPNTVKKHVSNIYSKLGVNNRRKAIAKAKEVGLLPPV